MLSLSVSDWIHIGIGGSLVGFMAVSACMCAVIAYRCIRGDKFWNGMARHAPLLYGFMSAGSIASAVVIMGLIVHDHPEMFS